MKNLNFGQAIEALKEGKCVARGCWNIDYWFITKQTPTQISKEIVPNMTSLSDEAKIQFKKSFDSEIDQIDSIYYSNQILLVKMSNVVDSYVATTEDIFAEDWFILD